MERDRLTPEERFTRLFDAHYAAVRAYAWRRGPDLADDIVAETFTIVWQRLGRVPADPLPWLIGVARNVRRNLERGERRRRERETRCVEPVGALSPVGAVELAGAVEDRASLRAALRCVSERDRELLLLAAWEGLDNAALAAVLGCTRTAAAVRLFRARKRLTVALTAADEHEARRALPRDPEGSLRDEY